MNTLANSIVDLSEYANLDNILDRPSLHNIEDYELVKNIAELGHVHSKSGIRYSLELAEYIDEWEKVFSRTPAGINSAHDAYTLYASATKRPLLIANCKRCKERELNFMKRMIPLSYAVWGACCLLLAAMFTIMLLYGRWVGHYIINPIINLALCVASIGLTITVTIAIIDWRQRLHAQKK